MKSVEQQLHDVQKSLLQLRSEYNELSTQMTHDLSAILRHTHVFSQEIERQLDLENYDEVRRIASMISNSGAQGRKIVAELRNYVDLSSSKLNFTEIAFESFIRDIASEFDTELTDKNAIIELETLPRLTADRQSLRKIFYEILKNSILYQTDGDQPLIKIVLTEDEHAYNFIVSDNGIGIRKTAEEKVFGVLIRACEKVKYPGIGMGLAAVKKLVLLHNGSIDIVTSSNKGTTIALTIGKMD